MINFSPGVRHIHLSEVDSTSNYLAALSSSELVNEFTTVSADFQTSGKGQRGNSWESAPGRNLLFSTILYPEFLEARKQFLLSQVISLAVKEELDGVSDGFSIKWPNDIYWHEKKICGMLIETDLLGSSIKRSSSGISINVNQVQFLGKAPSPVSLHQITHNIYDLNSLLTKVVGRIADNYALLKEGKTEELISRYHSSLFRKEGFHLYKDQTGEFMAAIASVKPEGTLVLRDENGRERNYAFKEVQYIL